MMQDDLRTARGKRYYDILKTILRDIGPDITADARQFASATGKLTPMDVGRLARKYDLNYKATCEWLEESGVLPAGTHASLIERGFKVRDVMERLKHE